MIRLGVGHFRPLAFDNRHLAGKAEWIFSIGSFPVYGIIFFVP